MSDKLNFQIGDCLLHKHMPGRFKVIHVDGDIMKIAKMDNEVYSDQRSEMMYRISDSRDNWIELEKSECKGEI